RDGRQAIESAFGISVLDTDVLSLHPSEVAEALAECLVPGPRFGGRERRQKPDPGDFCRLLRARRERPRGGAGEQCNELAPFHRSPCHRDRAPAIRRNRADHSGLMLAARFTLAHFSVSSIKSFPKSAGDNGIGTLPRPMIRPLTLGSERAVLISRLSFSMMFCGVPRGTATPFQVLAS